MGGLGILRAGLFDLVVAVVVVVTSCFLCYELMKDSEVDKSGRFRVWKDDNLQWKNASVYP